MRGEAMVKDRPASWHFPRERTGEEGLWLAGITVEYGRRVALKEIHLQVPRGEIFGLLGPNGAGKTTCFRVLATLLEPLHGEIRIDGKNPKESVEEVRKRIAYMPDMAPLPSDLKAVEYLRFYAEAYGFWGKERDRRVDECLESVELTDRKNDICIRLSLGMRQRLALARCLLHRPRFLILDEPASGMDAMARIELREALRRQAVQGATIILSSHVLGELDELCTSLGFLQAGQLLQAGPIREVLHSVRLGRKSMSVRAVGQVERLMAWLQDQVPQAGDFRISAEKKEVQFSWVGDDVEQAELFGRLAGAGLGVLSFAEADSGIESVMRQLHREGRGGDE